MQQGFDAESLRRLEYLLGNEDAIVAMLNEPARALFDEESCAFLDDVSRFLLKDPFAKRYSDVVTFGFWARKSSVAKMERQYGNQPDVLQLGRGVAFHIAPSNVPVNFAYSLAVGLLAGNSNIVRVPSKDYPQVTIICKALKAAAARRPAMARRIALVRYGHDRDINDLLSSICDVRIVWGGDATISELRKSPLPSRAVEVTFADRYSLALIDSDVYLALADKAAFVRGFFNDTYFSDQNACTSPKLVAWIGSSIDEAKADFWGNLHLIVEDLYEFQPIQGVNKLTECCLAAVRVPGIRIIDCVDNLIVRVEVPIERVSGELFSGGVNSGLFFECDITNIMELKAACDDKRCQTFGLLGDVGLIMPLLKSGIKGIDRVVSIGATMDFGLIWDGYSLISQLSRAIVV